MGAVTDESSGPPGSRVVVAGKPVSEVDRADCFLFRRFPRLGRSTRRLNFTGGPSPVRRLASLSGTLATDVWIKDDGGHGSLYGGNKARKLEFVLAHALAQRARTVLTTGGIGSNHVLATAIYGRSLGLNVALALGYESPDRQAVDNLLATASAGATIHFTRSYPVTALVAPYLVSRYWARDRRKPYVIGPGASSPRAALGYVNAALELAEQVRRGELPEPASIVIPLGTGGTAAGLLAGLRLAGLDSRVFAVAVGRAPTTWRLAVKRLARATAQLIARRSGESAVGKLRLDGLEVVRDWIGPGLGQASDEGVRAAELLADVEGCVLDPIYTAKAMAALLGLADSGCLPGPVLFWQTANTLDLPAPDADAAARLPAALRRVCSL